MISAESTGRKYAAGWIRKLKAFGSAVDGLAALEFALLGPLMIYTLLAASDLASALSITRRMTNAADVIAELVSQQVDGGVVQGSVNNTLLMGDFDSIVTTLPDLFQDAAALGLSNNWQNDVQVIATSVQFGPQNGANPTCVIPPGPALIANTSPPVPSCTDATVTWSAGFTAARPEFTSTRTCGQNTLTETKQNVASPGLTTLPKYLYQPGSVIVVDVFFVFRPLFTKWLTGPFTFQRTAYLTPRFFVFLNYGVPSTKGTTVGSVTTYPPDPNTNLTSCVYTGTLP